MHHCYRAIVLLCQVRIPKDLLCVWPQESAGNNGCHAGEIPDHAFCLQRVSGQGKCGEDPRREEGEEAKAWWLIQNTEIKENLWNKHASHLTPLRVNSGKQDNNNYLVVCPTLWMRYAYAHLSMHQGLGGSGWHTEVLCFFRHFVFFFRPPALICTKKLTRNIFQKTHSGLSSNHLTFSFRLHVWEGKQRKNHKKSAWGRKLSIRPDRFGLRFQSSTLFFRLVWLIYIIVKNSCRRDVDMLWGHVRVDVKIHKCVVKVIMGHIHLRGKWRPRTPPPPPVV